jgi:hypothetical protein
MYPLRSKTTYTETLDNEVCVYEWIRHEVHALNATAAGVWQLCDGKTSVAEMAERLGVAQLPHAEELVEFALEEFQRKHLLDADHVLLRAGPAISRRVLLRRGLTAALLPVVTSVVAPTPLEAQSPAARSKTFAFTGVSETFIVPPGVTALRVSAFGAQGRDDGSRRARGGLGGSVTATLVVTPGEALVINVGGVPMSDADISAPGDLFAGGFNGGGAAGRTFPWTALAGPGGGASDVRRGGGAFGNRVVVAGGGGGGGTADAGSGGAGGGTRGGDGGFAFAGEAGIGGTQTAGGAGGVSVFEAPAEGGAGSLGIGGGGGHYESGSLSHFQFGGGGGGGGSYGGGGGAIHGGGGGGSSFVDPSATGVVHVQGTRVGAGLIILTW